MTGPAARIQQSVGATTTRFQAFSASMAQIARDGVVLIGTGQQITQFASAPVKAIFKTQDALGELSSLGIEQLGALEGAAKSFSSTWAGTTKSEFLTAAYDIKSGIASLTDAGVAGYTSIAGVTAKATKATVAEMTSLFAMGHSIYKDYYDSMSDLEFGEMFSGGIAQSVQMFRTTGSGMAQAISALGGSATSANVPLEEQLAILGMLQATMSGSEAGTKYTAFLAQAGKAGQELGLSFTDASGQLKAMPEILAQLQSKFGETLTAADKIDLQRAFGTIEAVKLIELLYGNLDDLQGNILTLYDTMGKGMSITEEMANKINAPPGQSWERLKQKIQGTVETVGNAMLPQFTKMQEVLQRGADAVSALAERHPGLVSGIMYTVMAFGALLMAMGVAKITLGGLGMLVTGGIKGWALFRDVLGKARYGLFLVRYGLFNVRQGLSVAAGAAKTAAISFLTWARQGIASAAARLPGLIASVWSFTAALLANPVTWIIIGIVALTAAIYLLWKNWDSVAAFLSGTWQAACAGVMAAIEWVKGGIGAVIGWIGEKVGMLRDFGANLLNNMVEGIKSVAMRPVEAVREVLSRIRNLLPFSDAKEGPLCDLTLSGSRVFTTWNDGMLQTADLPAQTMENALSFDDGVGKNPSPGRNGQSLGRTTIIEKLILAVDLKTISDLQKLKALIEELEDSCNSDAEVDADIAWEGSK